METMQTAVKVAETDYPVHELIRRRWSPRAFSDSPVEPDTLLSLLEAARWAPSSFNEQPWSFIVATKDDRATFERLLGCLVEGNARWASHAPVLMLSVAKLDFSRSGKPNRHAFHDVGLAVENLIIQATAMGLFAHQMAGFDVAKAREQFSIPQGYEPCAAIALGHLGAAQSLPEPLRASETAPRSRKRLSQFVFTGRWGEPSAVIPKQE